MPGHQNPFEVEVDRLLSSTQVEDPQENPFEVEVGKLLADSDLYTLLNPFQVEVARLRRQEEGGPDLFRNVRGLLDWTKGLGRFGGVARTKEEFFSPKREAERELVRAGMLTGAFLKPAEAIAQVPGLLGLGIGDKTVDFLQRAQIGLHSSAEKAGLAAGMTEEDIASAYTTGDFIGFVSPVVASLKIATFLLRSPLLLTAATRVAGAGKIGAAVTRTVPVAPSVAEHIIFGNLATDLSAGAIFGGVFKPADTWKDRAGHILEESALFGVMRIGINFLTMPIRAFRLNRLSVLKRDAGVESVLEKWRNGESVIIDSPKQALALSKLLSEEAYVTNSSAAQEILRVFQDEAALVQGIITASEAGQTSGIIRGLSGGFAEVETIITKLRGQFPALKFTTVRRADGLNVFFGTKGLSNVQKGQFKAEGRIQGQGIEKNGIRYEYVRMRGDKIVVRTHTGKTTALIDKNITDLMHITEEIPAIGAIEALYKDFASKLNDGVKGLDVGGVIPEQEIIKQLRDGKSVISNEARRPFDIGTVVVYPEELGIGRARLEIVEPGLSVPFSATNPFPGATFNIFDNLGERILDGKVRAYLGEGGMLNIDAFLPTGQRDVFGASKIKSAGRQIIELFEASGHKVNMVVGLRLNQRGREASIPRDFFFRGLDRAEDVAEAILRGEPGAAILEPPNVMSFESMVDAWAKEIDFPTDAPDMTTIRAYFGQRARADFWKSVPDADMKILEKIRAEQFRLVEEGEIPLNAYARNKGFEVERGEAGTVILRHLSTGRRVQYGSERVALNGLNGVINTEADMLGGTLLPVGNHGIGGWTGGFRPSDGIFTFDGKVPTREYINDLPLTKFFQNNMDMFTRIEEDIGIPLFSEVFNRLDSGVNANRNFYEPWAKKVEEAWKGLKINEKVEVTEAWRILEGRSMTNAKRLAEARSLGLSKRQLKAFEDAREIFDVWGEMLGLKDNGQWIEGYYGHIQPYMQKTGGIGQLKDIWGSDANIPPQHRAFMMEHRTGDMPMIEMDPEVVMHRYLRTMGFKLYVGDVYEQARALVVKATTPKIGDLTGARADALLRKALAVDPKADMNTPIMPPVVRNMLGEYLVVIKGNPSTAQGTMMRFGQALFEQLGVKVDRNVIEQYVNNSLSMMYGSAMGLRPSMWARDATQNMWMTYTRMGAEHGGTSLKQAMTDEGWQEVVDVGAIRGIEAGLAAADRIFEVIANSNAIKAINPRNPFHLAFASTARLALRTSNLGSKTARKFLVPYASQDGMNRAWSYWWYKYFTAKHLDRYNAGTISWAKFREDGLPFFHDVIKKKFGDLYNAEGREVALRWIAKQGTDESNFIYGVGAQMGWMQNSVGRFAGMFGTWSVWAMEFYLRRAKNGTPRQRAALYARTVALMGAFANMSLQTGISMWSWIAPVNLFGWAGGPFVDWLIQLRRVYKSPLDQKADALNVLANSVGRIALPGQGFVRDVRRSLDAIDPRQGALMMLLGKPVDDYNYSLEFLFDPRFNEGINLDTIAQEGLRSLQGIEDFPRIPILELTSPVSRRAPRQPLQPTSSPTSSPTLPTPPQPTPRPMSPARVPLIPPPSDQISPNGGDRIPSPVPGHIFIPEQ